MSVSLIITTYNWPAALDLVLQSVAEQSVAVDEVIIADDGSDTQTSELVAHWQDLDLFRLVHSRQQDLGFRAARSRNKAIAQAIGDYLIVIDGDMVLHRHFVKDHLQWAAPERFVQGSRIKFDQRLSEQLSSTGKWPKIWQAGIGNRKNMLRSRLLAKLASKPLANTQRTRSCNMAFWRDDAIAINGFDNRFESWGYEDTDFTQRLLNLGRERIYLKFAANAFHLYHPEASKQALAANQAIFTASREQGLRRCDDGLGECFDAD